MTREENERFQRALKFAENHRPSGGFSNLYVLSTTVDDVPTREFYGMNVTTHSGFRKIFGDKSTWPTNLYVGYGTDTSVNFYTTNAITNISTPNPATVSRSALNTDEFFEYPMWYDSTSGLISLICKFMECYFPDQASGGPSSDITIAEYGIGSAIDDLWTHSWLYDIQGDRITNFHKHPNERLNIDVYFVLTYNKSLIETSWNNGKYCAMTTMYPFIHDYMGLKNTKSYTYRRYDAIVNRNATAISTLDTQNNADIIINQTEAVINKAVGNENGYVDGFIYRTDGFVCVEPQTETSGDDVSVAVTARWVQPYYGSYGSPTGGSHITSTSLNELFGHTEEYTVPFTNLSVTNVYLYNYTTGKYDNPTQFINNDNHYYTETPMGVSGAIPIYYTHTVTQDVVKAYLHVNTKYKTDPILKFQNNNTAIYATDEYWLRNEWELITNPADVPLGLRSKKFYISNTNETLNPVRTTQEFEMVAEDTRSTFAYNDLPNEQYASFENYTDGYFGVDTHVYIPRKSINYTIPNLTSDQVGIRHWCYQGNVFSIGSNGTTDQTDAGFYLTNLSEALDDTIPTDTITTHRYTLNDATNGFSSTVKYLANNAYCTETSSGVLGFQAITADEFVAIHIGDELQLSTRRFKFTARMGCCICDSTKNRIALFYQNKIYVKQYNVSTNVWTDTHEYDLPSGYAEPVLMFGLRDKLWVTDGSNYMVYYDLANTTSGTGQGCDTRMALITSRANAPKVEMTFLDETIVLYKWKPDSTDRPFTSCGYYVQYSDPVNSYKLSYTTPYTEYDTGRLFMKVSRIRTNTIALVIGHGRSYGKYQLGSCRLIADFGKLLNPPIDGSTGISYVYDKNWINCKGVNGRCGIYTYGPNYLIQEYGYEPMTQDTLLIHKIPIEFALTHVINGTTKTISAINNTRHIKDKSWHFQVSNIKNVDYGDTGLPPGVKN